MPQLLDGYGREIDYLRISVTDRCNLSCIYCVPPEGYKLIPQENILTLEEIFRVAKISVGMGVKKIKLTGGEPLARKGITELVSQLAQVPGLKDLSMTTNGILLAGFAEKLSYAGLKRVNVSVDSLDAQRFKQITRGGDLARVLSGVKKAQKVGLKVKINTVALKGINDTEILDFVNFSQTKRLEVRFIEFMPLSGNGWSPNLFIPLPQIKKTIVKSYHLTRPQKNGVATVYELKHGGRIGFIPTMTEPFCSGCSRIRLTSWGGIRPCLFSNLEYNLLPSLRKELPDEKIVEIILQAVKIKPTFNPYLDGKEETKKILMRNVGG